MADDADSQRKLARILLIELMAYQFASPVRWIETQDTILSRSDCEKVIEIGPDSTLVGMFQRTITNVYETAECARPQPRELLNSEKHTKKLYYENVEQGSGEIPSSPGHSSTKTPPKEKTTTVTAPSREPVRIQVDDEPVKAKEVVITIVSRALKKAPADIDVTKSIKSLTGGRSTLENEIVGDLNSEFSSLPDRTEDISLEDVWTTIQSRHRGTLGKVSTAIINSMFTSKMGAMTVAAARQQLQVEWGLQPGRQDSCLLLAVTMQPPTRISTDSEEKAFIDTVVENYAAKEKIPFNALSAGVDTNSTGVPVDPEVIRAQMESLNRLSKQLLDVYAGHIGLDLDTDRRELDGVREEMRMKLQDAVTWTAEHGPDYAQGIQPQFDARKVRFYDSSWNWARQRLLALFYNASALQRGEEATLNSNEVYQACDYIANAAGENIRPILREIMAQFESHTAIQSIFSKLDENCRQTLQSHPAFKGAPVQKAPRTTVDNQGKLHYQEIGRNFPRCFAELAMPTSQPAEPDLHLKEKYGNGWVYSPTMTAHFHAALDQVQKYGETFTGQTVLITGAGIGSIGAAMMQRFLQGGARVITTTSSLSPEVARKYQSIYMDHGARGSELVVVPFNQGSVQDVMSLLEYVYGRNGLGWDLDYLVPFAAISETARTLESIDGKSELAHRIMLTNVLRLLGAVKTNKEKFKYRSHPTQVILPLSPNHGSLGGDGLYCESKVALETLFNRWHSEDWQDYLSICGAVIGWTRGTGLMNQNDLVAEGIESAGMRTFSQEEMAHALVCLCVRNINEICQDGPIYADLTGRMGQVQGLSRKLQSLRQELRDRADIQAALCAEAEFERQCYNSLPARQEFLAMEQKAHVRLDFPAILDHNRDIRPLGPDLQGMVDLDRVVVVTGFSELGPHGNSRTRWEMEAYGQFSLEGAVEMAWLMGFIRHFCGNVNGHLYSGWVDAETGQPVADADVKGIYEERILAHSGIRFIEPEVMDGYDPNKKQFLHEILLQQDLDPIPVPEALAKEMKLQHGEYADIQSSLTPDLYHVRLRKGARLLVPRAMQFNRTVAGQIPTGWDPKTYGIPEDIVNQVDRVTLFTLICTVEALLSSGITDPYELYEYIHVSEASTCIGSGFGGAQSLAKMFTGRQMGEDIQKDILQETFINTIGAWVNMLLISGSGPLRTPVGACATAIESLELGYDTIVTGKAKFCLVGGCDDLREETCYEFANMKATSNTHEELARGRAPSEMSRPATSTRNGFLESQGCGLQVLTTAQLALQMGLPIRGIVAFVNTSSDKAGRSVPAPGKGVLTNARHKISSIKSPLMSLRNRQKRLDFRRAQIAEAREDALRGLQSEMAVVKDQDPSLNMEEYMRDRHQQLEAQFRREEKDACYSLGNDFWRNDPYIAPLAGALATWGLTIDDLDVASMHGTSTVLNDKNESSVIQQQLKSLGRRSGNLVLTVFQKYLTGHSKGAAGAWMLNGALQMLDTGLVPGNRNADNIDSDLEQFDLLAYIHRPVQTHSLKAVSVTSFGFGQKGAQAICVHPRHLFATITEEEYQVYLARRLARQKRADQYFYKGFNGNSLFRAKTSPPFAAHQEAEAYLNPEARFHV
ncbi:hypothetical protein FE257_005850 [Aspergillus nanangensis]|uniref:Ketosynthase family 3 (KS3) domain-containing protein n=1 Tax=Aspergillus nanangensis TaxID=2582783 RepID=A0AAD4CPR4_ASPNN|nr:hypothetical protein FE257_005850 [Aspergillus nanangensis]